MEEFYVEQIYIQNACVSGMYSLGQIAGIGLDSGTATTTSSLVFDGYAINLS